MIGAGLLAVCGALTTGFFNSVGEMAGEKYVQSSADLPASDASQDQAASNNAISDGAPLPEVSSLAREGAAGALASQPIVIDTVELSFGAQASEPTREKACTAAITAATKRAEYQCQSIAQEQKASSFELENNDPACSQCSQLASNWRCVTRLKPTCKIIE